jgi:UDP-4-amino-4,6-dideoxy-N-acetyl-beta-L-altrosamine transaminase
VSERLAIEGGTPVRRSLLPYGRQAIDDADIASVVATLKSDWLTTGPRVPEFEAAFADHVGARFAVAVCNGTAALHAAVFAAGVSAGDQVITTPMTFAASANSALYQGADVAFADVQPDTLNIDPAKVGAAVGPRTKAVVPVDYTGQPADLDELLATAKRHGLAVIEDAAHALGATYKGRRVGSLADLTIFSLHPVKHMTTGEGGVVTTNDERLAERLRLFRNHGITSDHHQRESVGSAYYEMVALGYNYRLTDIQCALGLSQMSKLSGWLARRQQIAASYSRAFADMPEIETPVCRGDRTSAWHLYVVKLDLERLSVDRDRVFRALRAENIGVNVHYIPVPWHPYYQSLGYKRGAWPVAEAAYERLVSLPVWPGMTDRDVADTVEAVQKVVAAYRR